MRSCRRRKCTTSRTKCLFPMTTGVGLFLLLSLCVCVLYMVSNIGCYSLYLPMRKFAIFVGQVLRVLMGAYLETEYHQEFRLARMIKAVRNFDMHNQMRANTQKEHDQGKLSNGERGVCFGVLKFRVEEKLQIDEEWRLTCFGDHQNPPHNASFCLVCMLFLGKEVPINVLRVSNASYVEIGKVEDIVTTDMTIKEAVGLSFCNSGEPFTIGEGSDIKIDLVSVYNMKPAVPYPQVSHYDNVFSFFAVVFSFV